MRLSTIELSANHRLHWAAGALPTWRRRRDHEVSNHPRQRVDQTPNAPVDQLDPPAYAGGTDFITRSNSRLV